VGKAGTKRPGQQEPLLHTHLEEEGQVKLLEEVVGAGEAVEAIEVIPEAVLRSRSIFVRLRLLLVKNSGSGSDHFPHKMLRFSCFQKIFMFF
jgi:hypothetical protein